ncbi:MAG: thiamine diphosphokinase [Firmicutes bacterium]|nr:thiamine diphosphokinase [Bacillota bacterium]
MGNRCVIVGGAEIGQYARLRTLLRRDDDFFFCDCGLRHAKPLGVEPTLIVGDFDSYPRPNCKVETIVLPREKDDTDTAFAAKEALRRGYREVLLLGAVGQRLDHTLGNVYLLLWLARRGVRARLVDDYSEMELIGREGAEISDGFAYFSLLNITGRASGITVTGAKYPLADAEISSEYQYGISNEVQPGGTARVSVARGELLLVKVYGAADSGNGGGYGALG